MTDDIELNKRLHELIGLCWHEKVQDCIVENGRVKQSEKCSCGHVSLLRIQECHLQNIVFNTGWDAFGIAWDFIRKHKRYWEFMKIWGYEYDGTWYMHTEILNPKDMSEAIADFFWEPDALPTPSASA